MSADLLQGFFLGELRVEPLTGQIDGPAGARHLQPKAMQVLLCLAEHAGEVVPREQLIASAWGDEPVGAGSLSQVISQLRQALDDQSDRPVFIQTLPRRGYRLLVDPTPLSGGVQRPSSTAAAADPEDGETVPETGLAGFWSALMKHGVVQAAVAYILFGWLLIQIADATFDPLGLPELWQSLVMYTVIGGLPVVVVLAWFLETAGGRLIRDRGLQSGRFLQGLERNYLAIFAAFAVSATGVFVYSETVGFPVQQEAAVAQPAPQPPPEWEIQPNSIAVLKFFNIDGSEETRIFSEGLSEDVLDGLAAVPGLLVSSRGDSWSLHPNTPSDTVRSRLRVAYYVEGSVRRIDDELRIVVQLIDSERGFHLLSRGFERSLDDFLGLQREITRLIVANLRVALPESEELLPSGGATAANLDAYVLYRRGMEQLHQPTTLAVLDEAVAWFEQALAQDPGFPAAHAGLCRAHVRRYDFTGNEDYISTAEQACDAALAVSGRLDEVYTALGNLYGRTGRQSQARAAYEQALAINPQSVAAISGLARRYEEQQEFAEAESLLRQAVRLQPGNWRSLNSLGGFLFASGRYEEAAEAYRMIGSLDAENWQGLGNLGGALLMTGDFEAAAKWLNESVALEPDRTNLSNLAIVYYYLGRYEESVALHRDSVEKFPEDAVAWLNLADALRFSSHPAEATAAYRRAAELDEKRLRVDPGDPMSLCQLAWSSAMLGDAESARDLMQRALLNAPRNPQVHYFDALIHTHQGETDEALSSVNLALANGYPAVLMGADPLLASLQGVKPFAAMIANYSRAPRSGSG